MSSSNQASATNKKLCIHANVYTKIKTVYLNEFKVTRNNKEHTLTGYALFDTLRGQLIRIGDELPYFPAGGQDACESIVSSGLVGVPELYISTAEQRKRIFTAKKYKGKSD